MVVGLSVGVADSDGCLFILFLVDRVYRTPYAARSKAGVLCGQKCPRLSDDLPGVHLQFLCCCCGYFSTSPRKFLSMARGMTGAFRVSTAQSSFAYDAKDKSTHPVKTYIFLTVLFRFKPLDNSRTNPGKIG
jgi:hypothetical protein